MKKFESFGGDFERAYSYGKIRAMKLSVE